MEDTSNLFDTYNYPEPVFVRGEGARLFDDKGRDYLDLTAGIAVNSLGHCHPHLVQALKSQADKLWHTSNLFAVPGREKLAKRLCLHSFADKVFFTNSGAEALECSIKTARRYHFDKGNPQRFNILTFEGAFHGRTLATIAAGGKQKYLEGFGPKMQGFVQLPFGDAKAVEEAVDENTAALLIEPTMGEGGVREHSREFLRHLRHLCDKNEIALIYDEVQTGIARTGKLFAYEWSGAAPDIMALAKGLGGGFPMGGCLASEEFAASMTVGTHGSTFGGNPLAMAVGNAVLDIVLADGFLEQVNRTSGNLLQHLSEYVQSFPQLFDETRGRGLLLGLKCKVPNGEVVAALHQEAVLAAPAGDNIIRLLPPLNITEEDLRDVHQRMRAAFETLADNYK